MHRFKSAILEKLPNCQNGTFGPVHKIWNFFWPKVFFWSIMKTPIRKNIHNMSQGPPNPGFMQKKVQKGDFLKKPSRELNFLFCFRFLWISRRPRTLNREQVFFWLSKTCTSSVTPLETWFKINAPNIIEVSSALFHPDSCTPFPLGLYLSFMYISQLHWSFMSRVECFELDLRVP